MKKKYQVFISSTYKDLIEERAIVSQCLLECDCIPVGMEQFPASGMSQMEYIKMMLNDCDYYILILAGRYGSIDTDGIGFTEKEYDYAKSIGLPVMSFVIEDIGKLQADKCENSDDGRKLLEKFRKKVCTNALIKYYKTADDLRGHVAVSIQQCKNNFPAAGWVRASEIDSNEAIGRQMPDHYETRVKSTVVKAEPEQSQQFPKAIHNIGDTILFGKYPQSSKGKSKEPIEWNVLAKDGNKALVISKYTLDCKKYNGNNTNVTWETCTLRTWLNNTFYNAAFSSAEQAKIQTTIVTADKNPSYSTNPGNSTNDTVFLLSIAEANKYFPTDESRKCVPTAYAKAQGAYTNRIFTKGGAATCGWWLRSPGYNQNTAACVLGDGSVYYLGNYVNYPYGCVRPALWINLES